MRTSLARKKKSVLLKLVACNTIKKTAKLELSNTKRQGFSLFIKLKMINIYGVF